MAYYDNNNTWGASTPTRQGWEQPAAPSRSGNSSTVNREPESSAGIMAFLHQFEEVDRAIDNLVKSGKPFPAGGRRDSMPMASSRPSVDYGSNSGSSMGPRHSVGGEFEGGMRPGSASNLQNFYANQRYGPRSEGDPAAQAKRRAAAARERELRNYHQEQQYNRSVMADVSGNKSDRSLSPNTMSEDDRRELIARQHRALYGNDASQYTDASRPASQDARVATAGMRGHSPLAFDPYYGQNPPQGAVQLPNRDGPQASDAAQSASKDGSQPPQPRSPANSTSSPASGTQPASFSLFDNANPASAQQTSRTSNSSPGGSPTGLTGKGTATSAAGTVAPIGTRPAGPPQNKRATTPGLPSPLSFGYTPGDGQNNERNAAGPNANGQGGPNAEQPVSGLGAWGNNGGVWGPKSGLGLQTGVAWS